MKRVVASLLFALALCGFSAQGQTYTFKCITDPETMDADADSCEGCAAWLIQSRSFDGLLVYKDSIPFRWIEAPYTLKVRSDTVDIWEHTSPPSYMGRNKFFPDRLSIRLSETNFATMQDFLDSAFCNSLKISWAGLDTTALFYASDSIDLAPIYRSDTITIVGRNLAEVTFDSLLRKYIINVEGVGGSGIDTVKMTAPVAGFTISGSPGVAPVATFVFALSNDLAAVEGLSGAGIPARTAADTWSLRTLQAGAGISITNADGAGGDPTITNTGDLSNTNELQAYAHTHGVNTYTNDLNPSGGTWSLAAGGIIAITGTGGAVTISATQKANNGLSDNEDGNTVRLGNRYMNLSDGLFDTDRKVNANAKMLFIGDNTDSLCFIVDGTNDRVGIGRLPAQRLDILGTSGTYARVSTSGAVSISGFILNNTADLNASWALYRQDDGDFGIGSSTWEWPSGTLTTPILIKPNPPDNSLYMDGSGFVALGGTTAARRFDNYGETRLRDLVTDTPTGVVGHDADGDLATVGFSGMSMVAGVLTANDASATNEAWTIDGDDTDTELITNQTLKFQGSGGISTNYVPATNILEINGTAATVTAANNGVELSATTVQWGGSLIKNTTIDQDGFYYLHKDGRKALFRYNTGNPFTDVNVTGTVDITGKGLAPSMNIAPSEDNILTVRGHNGTSTFYANALFFGVYPTAADGAWIQSRSESAYTTHYLLNINPRGGRVAIGRDPESDDPDAHVTISRALTGSTITGMHLHLENSEGNKAGMSMGVGIDQLKSEIAYFDGADAVRVTNRNTQTTSSVRIAVGGETADEVVIIPAGTGFGTNVTTNIKSTIQDEGSLGLKTSTASGDLTLNETHCVVVKNAGGAGVTWTLPDPDAVVGRFYWLMNHTSQVITLSRNVTSATGVTFNTLNGGEWCIITAFNGNGWRGAKQVSL